MYYLLIELCVTVYIYISMCIYICTTNIWLCICKDISADLQLPPWIGGRAWPQSCRIKDVHVRLHDACSYACLCNIMQYIYTHNTTQYDTVRYDVIWYDMIRYLYMIYVWYGIQGIVRTFFLWFNQQDLWPRRGTVASAPLYPNCSKNAFFCKLFTTHILGTLYLLVQKKDAALG